MAWCMGRTVLKSESNSMPISSIASITCLKALRMLLKIMQRHSSFSFFEKPCAYIKRICFKTVDFPDSPAPVTDPSVCVVSQNVAFTFSLPCPCIQRQLVGGSSPNNKSLTSREAFFSSARIILSISLFFCIASWSPSSLPPPKHMIVERSECGFV